MSVSKHGGMRLVVVTLLLGASAGSVSGQLVRSAAQAADFSHAKLVCKIRIGPITEQGMLMPPQAQCNATCTIISMLKGDLKKEVRIVFMRHVNGWFMLNEVKEGEVYVVLLRGKAEPYQMFNVIKAVERVVKPRFGPKPWDRLLAELVAMWRANDADMHIPAIRQIGIVGDSRGSKVVGEAANSEDADIARAGLIAQYRMGIAPDAKRTMALFDERMLFVWCEESGRLQSDITGKRIMRREGGRVFGLRGLPDFDYATYVREGIKKEWVRRDENTLRLFFGVPWSVQRKECVPELVKLLDDPNKRVRWWAVICLAHTVEHVDRPQWEQYEQRENKELNKWRKWWKEKGDTFMAETAT